MLEPRAISLRSAAVILPWVMVGVGLVLMAPGTTQGQAAPPVPSGPETLFEKQCYSCHNIGGGDKKGPDLVDLTQRRKRDWLHRFIATPKSMKSAGDPDAVKLFAKYAPEIMPDQMLSPDQVDQILDLIDGLSKRKQMFIPKSGRLKRKPEPRDIPAGRSLFLGRTRLAQGGPACIACHSATGIGPLGGGSLGPDLTDANVRYKDVELASILKAPAFPVMAKIFANHEVTDEEVVQLFAYLQSVRKHTPDLLRPALRYFALSAAGMVILLVLTGMIWRGRPGGVRRQIVRSAR